MNDSTEKLSAPERWALLAARSTATESVPVALFLVLSGLLIAQGVSASMFLLLVLNATMVWERLGFTRLLRRKDRPQVIEHTLSQQRQTRDPAAMEAVLRIRPLAEDHRELDLVVSGPQPKQLAMLIARVRLEPKHVSTGNTKHWIGGEPMRRPHELQVVSDTAIDGFYLLYCGSDGEPMTDTFHLSLDDAFHQAEFEFTVQRDEWTVVSQTLVGGISK